MKLIFVQNYNDFQEISKNRQYSFFTHFLFTDNDIIKEISKLQNDQVDINLPFFVRYVKDSLNNRYIVYTVQEHWKGSVFC